MKKTYLTKVGWISKKLKKEMFCKEHKIAFYKGGKCPKCERIKLNLEMKK